MAYKSGICYCCHKRRPVEAHHTHPLEYGGRDDGEKVDLCADDHNIAHKEAEYYAKNGKFQEIDITIPYVENGYGHRLRIVIAKIIKAKNLYESGAIEGADEQRLMTSISWESKEHLRIAHAVKEAMHFKSLPRAIMKLVFDKYAELQQK